MAVDLVAVAAAYLGAGEVAARYELGNDALGSSLGDADLLCDVPHAGVGIPSDAQEDVRVVAEENPPELLVGRSLHDETFIANLLPRFSTREMKIVLVSKNGHRVLGRDPSPKSGSVAASVR